MSDGWRNNFNPFDIDYSGRRACLYNQGKEKWSKMHWLPG